MILFLFTTIFAVEGWFCQEYHSINLFCNNLINILTIDVFYLCREYIYKAWQSFTQNPVDSLHPRESHRRSLHSNEEAFAYIHLALKRTLSFSPKPIDSFALSNSS